ncbi:MAG: hypothetical protein HY787_27580 [Deltaproteobacteria bacterium]|nr:hypothetical protein [Deltaproteobacteria bacterium]
MSPAPTLNNNNRKPVEGKNLLIEIEPSYPLIVAITEFFRAHQRPQKALEICRMGLDYFPGDLGLRLELAMSYLDLSEKDMAWMEINTVVQELNQLAPVLDSIAEHFRQKGQKDLGEWFHQLSLVLSRPPGKNPEMKEDPPALSLFPEEEFQTNPPCPAEGMAPPNMKTGSLSDAPFSPGKENSLVHKNSPLGESEPQNSSQKADEKISLASPGKITREKEKPQEALSDSNILSTLTGWLTQLKEGKT